jgi:hypothetical protein
MTMFQKLGLIIGIPAFGWFVSLTDWRVGLALFLVLYANNLSQQRADGVASVEVQSQERKTP